MSILMQQYRWIQSSRSVMLAFIEAEIGNDTTMPVPEFNNKHILFLLAHVTDVYKHWLANFGMNMSLPYTDEQIVYNMETIYRLYAETDELTNRFMQQYNNDLDASITNFTISDKKVTATALELFTHVTTHEFHHKGQIMTMCRLLGHIPPDTDIIRT